MILRSHSGTAQSAGPGIQKNTPRLHLDSGFARQMRAPRNDRRLSPPHRAKRGRDRGVEELPHIGALVVGARLFMKLFRSQALIWLVALAKRIAKCHVQLVHGVGLCQESERLDKHRLHAVGDAVPARVEN